MEQAAIQVQVDASLATHAELLEQIEEVLAGHPGQIHATVLAECLAMFLVGHPDYLREGVLTHHVEVVKALIPAVEGERFGEAGHPLNLGRR